jgi:PhnB protein
MATKVTSYLSFNGNAREAAEFYKSVFGGEVYMDTYDKYADSVPVADADKSKVMHAYLKGSDEVELMLADTPTGVEYQEGSQLSLALSGEDEAQLRQYWDKLSDGGVVRMPLEKAPWGDIFGMLTDKFGVRWMVNVSSGQTPKV